MRRRKISQRACSASDLGMTSQRTAANQRVGAAVNQCAGTTAYKPSGAISVPAVRDAGRIMMERTHDLLLSFNEQVEEQFTWIDEVLAEAKKSLARDEVVLLPKTPREMLRHRRMLEVRGFDKDGLLSDAAINQSASTGHVVKVDELLTKEIPTCNVAVDSMRSFLPEVGMKSDKSYSQEIHKGDTKIVKNAVLSDCNLDLDQAVKSIRKESDVHNIDKRERACALKRAEEYDDVHDRLYGKRKKSDRMLLESDAAASEYCNKENNPLGAAVPCLSNNICNSQCSVMQQVNRLSQPLTSVLLKDGQLKLCPLQASGQASICLTDNHMPRIDSKGSDRISGMWMTSDELSDDKEGKRQLGCREKSDPTSSSVCAKISDASSLDVQVEVESDVTSDSDCLMVEVKRSWFGGCHVTGKETQTSHVPVVEDCRSSSGSDSLAIASEVNEAPALPERARREITPTGSGVKMLGSSEISELSDSKVLEVAKAQETETADEDFSAGRCCSEASRLVVASVCDEADNSGSYNDDRINPLVDEAQSEIVEIDGSNDQAQSNIIATGTSTDEVQSGITLTNRCSVQATSASDVDAAFTIQTAMILESSTYVEVKVVEIDPTDPVVKCSSLKRVDSMINRSNGSRSKNIMSGMRNGAMNMNESGNMSCNLAVFDQTADRAESQQTADLAKCEQTADLAESQQTADLAKCEQTADIVESEEATDLVEQTCDSAQPEQMADCIESAHTDNDHMEQYQSNGLDKSSGSECSSFNLQQPNMDEDRSDSDSQFVSLNANTSSSGSRARMTFDISDSEMNRSGSNIVSGTDQSLSSDRYVADDSDSSYFAVRYSSDVSSVEKLGQDAEHKTVSNKSTVLAAVKESRCDVKILATDGFLSEPGCSDPSASNYFVLGKSLTSVSSEEIACRNKLLESVRNAGDAMVGTSVCRGSSMESGIDISSPFPGKYVETPHPMGFRSVKTVADLLSSKELHVKQITSIAAVSVVEEKARGPCVKYSQLLLDPVNDKCNPVMQPRTQLFPPVSFGCSARDIQSVKVHGGTDFQNPKTDLLDVDPAVLEENRYESPYSQSEACSPDSKTFLTNTFSSAQSSMGCNDSLVILDRGTDDAGQSFRSTAKNSLGGYKGRKRLSSCLSDEETNEPKGNEVPVRKVSTQLYAAALVRKSLSKRTSTSGRRFQTKAAQSNSFKAAGVLSKKCQTIRQRMDEFQGVMNNELPAAKLGDQVFVKPHPPVAKFRPVPPHPPRAVVLPTTNRRRSSRRSSSASKGSQRHSSSRSNTPVVFPRKFHPQTTLDGQLRTVSVDAKNSSRMRPPRPPPPTPPSVARHRTNTPAAVGNTRQRIGKSRLDDDSSARTAGVAEVNGSVAESVCLQRDAEEMVSATSSPAPSVSGSSTCIAATDCLSRMQKLQRILTPKSLSARRADKVQPPSVQLAPSASDVSKKPVLKRWRGEEILSKTPQKLSPKKLPSTLIQCFTSPRRSSLLQQKSRSSKVKKTPVFLKSIKPAGTTEWSSSAKRPATASSTSRGTFTVPRPSVTTPVLASLAPVARKGLFQRLHDKVRPSSKRQQTLKWLDGFNQPTENMEKIRSQLYLQQQQAGNDAGEADSDCDSPAKHDDVTPQTQAKSTTGALCSTADKNVAPHCKEMQYVAKGTTYENYSIADIGSDDSTDDESKPKREIPAWAEGPQLMATLIELHYHPINTTQLFGVISPPNLNEMFDEKKPRFDKRTSSANWEHPLYNSSLDLSRFNFSGIVGTSF